VEAIQNYYVKREGNGIAMSSENNRYNILCLNCDYRTILNIVKSPKMIKLNLTSLILI